MVRWLTRSAFDLFPQGGTAIAPERFRLRQFAGSRHGPNLIATHARALKYRAG